MVSFFMYDFNTQLRKIHLKGKTITEMEDKLSKDIENICMGDITGLLGLIKTYTNGFKKQSSLVFHKQHYLVLILKWLVLTQIGR